MPTTVDTEVTAYAHCALPRCPGNQQEKVTAIRREVSETYREMGGDSPGVQRSWVTFHLDDETRPCPHCSKPREVTDQPRKTYAAMSGHDPMGLLGVPEFNAAKQPAPPNPLEKELAELREMVKALSENKAA